MNDAYLDDCEEWANADYLKEDAIPYLQARIRALVRELRKMRADSSE